MREQINSGTYNATRIKQTVPILYLPASPTQIEYPIGNNAKTSTILQIVALLAGVGWLVMIWLFGRWAVFATLARRKRSPALRNDFGDRKNQRQSQQTTRGIRLVWTDELRRVGKSYMAKRSAFDSYNVGDGIIVF